MTTTNYAWSLPIVGGNQNQWGTMLNNILTDIDAKMLPRNAPAVTGGLTVASGGASISGNVLVAGGVSATGASSNNQLILERTGSATGKWGIYTNSNSLFFSDNVASADRMVIDASGNLLVNNEISVKTNITSGSAATSFTGNDQRNFYAESYSNNTSQYRYMMNHAGSGLWGIGTSTSDQLIIGKASALNGAPSNILVLVEADGSMLPGTNGGPKIGSTSLRWGELWVTTGAFNTSNAVLKTPIRTMQDKELAAGYQMAQELGTFQWLDSVKEKGDKARRHVGLTVQRAAEIMESHGLKPWSYGFMGFDKWPAVTEIVDATEDDEGAYQEQVTRQKTVRQTIQNQTVEIVYGKPVLKVETVESDAPVTEQIQVVDADGKPVFIDVPEVPVVLDEEGNEATPAIPAHQVPLMHAVPVMETVQVWKRVKEVRPAGESYAFRSDQLAFFIAAGVAAKVGA